MAVTSAMWVSSKARSVPNRGEACRSMRPAHRSRASAMAGQEMRVWLPMLSIWVRIARVP